MRVTVRIKTTVAITIGIRITVGNNEYNRNNNNKAIGILTTGTLFILINVVRKGAN
jgi:hypothetical protein